MIDEIEKKTKTMAGIHMPWREKKGHEKKSEWSYTTRSAQAPDKNLIEIENKISEESNNTQTHVHST